MIDVKQLLKDDIIKMYHESPWFISTGQLLLKVREILSQYQSNKLIQAYSSPKWGAICVDLHGHTYGIIIGFIGAEGYWHDVVIDCSKELTTKEWKEPPEVAYDRAMQGI